MLSSSFTRHMALSAPSPGYCDSAAREQTQLTPAPSFVSCDQRFDVMGLVLFILAVRLGYLYALKYVRHLNR